MTILIDLPLELLNIVFGYLDIDDLFRVCSTCSYLHDVFRPDLLLQIVQHVCSDQHAVEKAVAESNHLMLCHTLLHCFLEHGVLHDFTPLLQREATLAAIPVGHRLRDCFVREGPWHQDTQFFLAHGASLDQVPGGINSLIGSIVLQPEFELAEVEERLDFLLDIGGTFHDMPYSYEELANELAKADQASRLLSILERGGALSYAPPSVALLLTAAYNQGGFNEQVEFYMTVIPDALTILLKEQVERHGLGQRLDDLIRRGASFDDLELHDLPEELPGDHAAAMKAVLSGGEALRTKDESGNYPLYYLAGYGFVALLKDAIVKGASVDSTNCNGVTALYIAALRGQHLAIKALVDAGADPSIVNDLGASPLHTAATHKHIEAARALFEGGANLEAKEKNGHTPLFQAVWRENVEMVQFLVDLGANIRETVADWTLIFTAAHRGNCSIVDILIQAGCDPSGAIDTGMTPMHAAAAEGHLACVQFLCSRGVDPMEPQGNGVTTIHVAAESGHTDVVCWLHEQGAALDYKGLDGATALHFAAGGGRKDTVQWLFEHGAQLLGTDNDHLTALHRACQEGHLEMAEFLIDRGLDVDALHIGGTTALGLAAIHGHVEVIQLLLQRGADPNLSTIPPLFLACSNDHPRSVQALLEGGADMEATISASITALHSASFYGYLEVVRVLLDAGADLGAMSDAGGDALQCATTAGNDEIVRLLLDRGASIHARGEAGHLAIHMAAENGWTKIVSLLLEHGNEVDARTDTGDTPLHVASWSGELDIMRYLVERGAKVSATNEGGFTPIHVAAMQGNIDAVRFLSGKTADPLQSDLFSRSPLHRALARGRWEAAKFLSSFPCDPNERDGYGRTILDWAARDPSSTESLAKLYPHQQGVPEDIDIDQVKGSICFLARRLLASGRRKTVVGFEELGHCLLALEELDDARLSFQNLVISVASSGRLQHEIRCHVCPWNAESSTGFFFVCTECTDIYLCDKCVQPSELAKNRTFCAEHIFLEINEAHPTHGESIPTDVQQWLEKLVQRYGATEVTNASKQHCNEEHPEVSIARTPSGGCRD